MIGLGVAAGTDTGDAGASTHSVEFGDSHLASDHVHECAETPPEDHADPEGDTADVVGWVDGYWYNEPLDIDDTNRLTEEEIEELTARTAARVEALRCHTFEELPPLEFLTRDEYRDDVESSIRQSMGEEDQQFADAQLASMLLVGTEEEAKEVLIEQRAGFPAAFYNTEDEVIGFITDDPDEIEIDQVTLAHELLHALQDQHFDIGTVFDEPTNDQFISSLAVVEGDAVLVDSTYAENCDLDEWPDDCIRPTPVAPGEPASWGLTIEQLAAYHSPLVAEVKEDEGWDGVDALLEEPPDSMVQVIDPDQRDTFEPADLSVPDRSDETWEPVETEHGGYDRLGQHALTAILIAPTFESGVEIVDVMEFQQAHAGGDFNYDISATDGWQGDQFHAYATDDGDVAGVWKLAWVNEAEAETFASAYEDLLAHRGGSEHDEYANVWTLEDGNWEMAVAVETDGDRLWIVTAPSVDELSAVHGDLELAADDKDLEERIETLEAQLEQRDSELEQRDERIDELEQEIEELRELEAAVEDVLNESTADDLDELEDALEAEDESISGFGSIVAVIGLCVAAIAIRRRS